jgi:hypothetical protein
MITADTQGYVIMVMDIPSLTTSEEILFYTEKKSGLYFNCPRTNTNLQTSNIVVSFMWHAHRYIWVCQWTEFVWINSHQVGLKSSCFLCSSGISVPYETSSSRFNPVSAGAGTVVPSGLTFASGFYIGEDVGGLSELCHKCVTYAHKRLKVSLVFHYFLKIKSYSLGLVCPYQWKASSSRDSFVKSPAIIRHAASLFHIALTTNISWWKNATYFVE